MRVRRRSEADFKAAYAAAEAANKEAGRLAQSMDHDGGDAGRREESGRCRRFRRGDRIGQGSRSAGKGIDLPGHQRKGTLERHGNTLSVVNDARRDRMTIRRRDFLKVAGAAAPVRHPAASRAQRRQCRRLRSRALRQCAHPAHDGYACAAPAGLFPRAERQSRHRRDAGQPAASGRQSLPRPLRHPPRQRRRLCLHLHRIRKGRRAIRQARRLRASEDAGRSAAQRRRRRTLAAARRRRPLAGHRRSPTRCRAPTWSRPRICSASRR